MLEKQKAEAMIRMKMLTEMYDLNPNLYKYLEEGKVYYSYVVLGLFGCIDTISYDENNLKLVQKFEKEHHAYVYHAIESETKYGKMLALLYVSSNEDEWCIERPNDNYIIAYVYNFLTRTSEIGSVFLASDNGALIRTA